MTNKVVKNLIENALQVPRNKRKAIRESCEEKVYTVDEDGLCFKCGVEIYVAGILREQHDLCPGCSIETASDILEIVGSKLLEHIVNKQGSINEIFKEITRGMVRNIDRE